MVENVVPINEFCNSLITDLIDWKQLNVNQMIFSFLFLPGMISSLTIQK